MEGTVGVLESVAEIKRDQVAHGNRRRGPAAVVNTTVEEVLSTVGTSFGRDGS